MDSLLQRRVHRDQQEADTDGELLRDLLERRSALASRVGNAPVDRLGAARELGADLADAVAERDHVVEALAGELAQTLGAPAGDVYPAAAHRVHRLVAQRLRPAAGARRAHRAPG